jgi:hypothetical protein
VQQWRGRGAAPAVQAPVRVLAVRGHGEGVPGMRMRQDRHHQRQLFLMWGNSNNCRVDIVFVSSDETF